MRRTWVSVLGFAFLAGTVAAQDCNFNGIDDACDLDCGPPGGACDVPGCGTAVDCDGNAVPAACDLAVPMQYGDSDIYDFWPLGPPPHAADLNNDGADDLIVTSADVLDFIRVYVMLNDGSGTFPADPDYLYTERLTSIDIVDMDNDGFLDWVGSILDDTIPDYGTGFVRWNLGDGTFPTSSGAGVGCGATEVCVGDYDTDGFKDMVISYGGTFFCPETEIALALNNGDRTFADAVDYPLPRPVRFLDIDNDGDDDIIEEYDIRPNLGGGSFGSPTPRTPSSRVLSGDLNGDGFVDLVLPRYPVHVLINQQDGTFADPVLYDADYMSLPYMILADMDGDGDLDVAGPRASGTDLHIIYNDGNGQFSPVSKQELLPGWWGLAAGNFDCQGPPDIAYIPLEDFDYTLFVRMGQGGGPQSVDCNDNAVLDACDVDPADPDGDGQVSDDCYVAPDGVPDECQCVFDHDGDGVVNPFDANAVMAQFGCPVGTGDPLCDRADVDCDGQVNPFDSNAVQAHFGACP